VSGEAASGPSRLRVNQRPVASEEKSGLTQRALRKSAEFAEKRNPGGPGEPGPYAVRD